MNLFRRSASVTIALLIALMATGVVGAQPTAPTISRTGQDGQTPADLCAAAVADAGQPDSRDFEAADHVLEDGVDYWAIICSEGGPIYVDLFEDAAPITVNNFVFLAQQGFYNGTTFHRMLPGFMVQGGDPTGTGMGGPGYMFQDETDNGFVFDRPGLLAMANAGADTNGSQFFVTFAATPWLDGNHTIFGEVYEGLNTAELLTPRNPEFSPTFDGDVLETVVIVDDPASVNATPDPLPDINHFQALVQGGIASQINEMFAVNEATSHAYDLDEAAAAWSDSGDELVTFMQGFLADSGFVGLARLDLDIVTCPENPEDLPIWHIGVRVAEYAEDGTPAAVIMDDTRSDQLVEAGAYDGYVDVAEVENARLYTRALSADETCADTGVLYALEIPAGRYLLTASLVLDGTIINAESSPTATEYTLFVMQDLVLGSISGTLDRANGIYAAAE